MCMGMCMGMGMWTVGFGPWTCGLWTMDCGLAKHSIHSVTGTGTGPIHSGLLSLQPTDSSKNSRRKLCLFKRPTT